jgi:hypothetical protein
MIKKTPHRPKDMNQLAKMIVDLSTGDYDDDIKKAPKKNLSTVTPKDKGRGKKAE